MYKLEITFRAGAFNTVEAKTVEECVNVLKNYLDIQQEEDSIAKIVVTGDEVKKPITVEY